MTCPLDARSGGRIVHPTQDRVLSLLELWRAQGLPDDFLLMGNLRKQIEQVGNGVPWQMAAVIGRTIADSMRASYDHGGHARLDIVPDGLYEPTAEVAEGDCASDQS
jgi:hypothetical protein